MPKERDDDELPDDEPQDGADATDEDVDDAGDSAEPDDADPRDAELERLRREKQEWLRAKNNLEQERKQSRDMAERLARLEGTVQGSYRMRQQQQEPDPSYQRGLAALEGSDDPKDRVILGLIDELQSTKAESRQIRELVLGGVPADDVPAVMKLMESGHFNSIEAAKLAHEGQKARAVRVKPKPDEEEPEDEEEPTVERAKPREPQPRRPAPGATGGSVGGGAPRITPEAGGLVTDAQWAKLMQLPNAYDYIRAQRAGRIKVKIT